eukprot:scaffold7453_cov177-Amphora_coffeaeformis.AAC.12
MGTCDNVVSYTKNLTVPKPGEDWMRILLGVLNFFFFGVGTMIAGCMMDDVAHILIGVCQLLLPFVGWLWSIIWGSKYYPWLSCYQWSSSRYYALLVSLVAVAFCFSRLPLGPGCSPDDYRQVEEISQSYSPGLMPRRCTFSISNKNIAQVEPNTYIEEPLPAINLFRRDG